MKQPHQQISPEDRAAESVRKILLRLFCTLRSNVEGVLANEDIEFLHDFRVANRRTRTVLSQTKGVLPLSVEDSFSPEFKWLGDVTGPCRDLDVFLFEMDNRWHQSEIDFGDLGPLKKHLKEKLFLEQDRVRTALESARFVSLNENWDRFLESGLEGETEPLLASASTIDVASPRIFKAYRRMWKRGTGIDIEPPAELLHQLRIDGKKLRYLLQVFSDLYPQATVTRFVIELKKLQEALGDFNDTEVQLALIIEFADQGSASAKTLVDVGRFAEAITKRQCLLRAEFSNRFELFAGDESRKLYKKTFKTR